ncbi:hypothetical protein PT277_02245 [Acetobacteraceae bacterium ESL0709]|nr:hypothetical protein [Acetobacteraceae bacterium ESL0697]MDF7677523.1 hypothetical protein [Acetobacteraceae bacterium ESL0709]
MQKAVRVEINEQGHSLLENSISLNKENNKKTSKGPFDRSEFSLALRDLLKNEINVDDIIKKYFPNDINYDVFISHSHMDEKDVLRLKGYIEKTYQKRCFVDSSVWYNVEEIINKLRENDPGHSYYYSSMYIMLTSLLTSMIEKCRIFLFLESENSTKLRNDINITQSPWIFHELYMCDFFAKNKILQESVSTEDFQHKIKHKINFNVSDFLQKMEFKELSNSLNPLDDIF